MFLYHSQLAKIKEMIADGMLGELRLIRSAFGFPFRGNADFRYDKDLGGGAMLDCGGYPIRLAAELLGETAHVTQASLSTAHGLDVDVYGSATMENDEGQVAQISFGMDNSYKCELELWGSTGCILTDRIFTAPDVLAPTVAVSGRNGRQIIELEPDDTFFNSINEFKKLLFAKDRQPAYAKIKKQAELVQRLKEMSQA